jgi:hypothetical protein
MALIEPRGPNAGTVIDIFPSSDSPLHLSNFFQTLYQRYEERFVYGAPLLADSMARVGFRFAGLCSFRARGKGLAGALFHFLGLQRPMWGDPIAETPSYRLTAKIARFARLGVPARPVCAGSFPPRDIVTSFGVIAPVHCWAQSPAETGPTTL